jgi:hypothetical protein
MGLRSGTLATVFERFQCGSCSGLKLLEPIKPNRLALERNAWPSNRPRVPASGKGSNGNESARQRKPPGRCHMFLLGSGYFGGSVTCGPYPGGGGPYPGGGAAYTAGGGP